MPLYVVAVELSGDSKTFKSSGYAGGFTNCAVPASDPDDAIQRAEAALIKDGYIVTKFDEVVLFEHEAWLHAPDFIKICEEAIDQNCVLYDSFEVYGH